MDIASIGGMLIALISVIVGVRLDGGTLSEFFNPAALTLVIGGTLGATLASVGPRQFSRMLTAIGASLTSTRINPRATAEELVMLANIARREGILALDDRMGRMADAFTRDGLQLVVDGVDPHHVEDYLETKLFSVRDRHERVTRGFEYAGRYAVSMGVLGTVIECIHLLPSMHTVSGLFQAAPQLLVAMVYGFVSANILWYPIGRALQGRSENDILRQHIIKAGILSIQAGENPKILEQRLRGYLSQGSRQRAHQVAHRDPDPEAVRW